jgi:hypothetical protein
MGNTLSRALADCAGSSVAAEVARFGSVAPIGAIIASGVGWRPG